MTERPILFSGPMVRAILSGNKTQTRRVVTPQPAANPPEAPSEGIPCDDVNTSGDGFYYFRKRGGFIDPRGSHNGVDPRGYRCPYGRPGDRLWVKETWSVGACADGIAPRNLDPKTWLRDNGGCWYKASNQLPPHPISPRGKTRPSIFMPRWASRITIEITGVRAERLKRIGFDDCMAEGIIETEHWHKPHSSLSGQLARAAKRISDPDVYIDKGWGLTAIAAYRELWDSINKDRGYRWDLNPWVWVVEFKHIKSPRRNAPEGATS